MSEQRKRESMKDKLFHCLGRMVGQCPACGYPIMRRSNTPHDPKGEALNRCAGCGAVLDCSKRYGRKP